MTEKKISMLVDEGEVEWNQLFQVMSTFQNLDILLCNTTWGQNRFLFPLLDRFDNLYLDINSNQANDILDTCKKHFGVERILFGSDYPNKCMGALKALVEYSG